MSVETVRIPARPRISTSRIILPTEHGSWAFLLEPLIAGCAVALNTASPWICLMALAAFFSRQPIKTLYVSRQNPNVSVPAFRFSIMFLALTVTGATASFWLAGAVVLYPAMVAALLAIQQFYLDLFRQGRSVWAELAGSAAISSSAAMLALAGGHGWTFAIALWAIFIARFVPSILYVRSRLLLEKGKAFDRTGPVLAHAAALIAVAVLAWAGLASILTTGMFAFLLGRSIVGLSDNRVKMKAMKIGIWEVIYGALTLASIIIGYYAGV